MTHQEIRQKFIDYFTSKGHKLIEPASLVPDADPTLLFTVAGMQQFKEDYQNPDQAPAPRVITIQPCIRTVDIEEVGDNTHCTVFEMMGFFSFGYQGQSGDDEPYFKDQAIKMAWEFYTQVLGFNPAEMRITYFAGDAKRPEDVSSRELVKECHGVSLIEPTIDDNFWGPVGSSGPCGPCVEFYYRGVEVGNVVFNEYFKDEQDNYTPLEFQGVDTGIGFERIVFAAQGKTAMYESDQFIDFMNEVKNKASGYIEKPARILVDHAKASLYLLADGVKPGNKGRDYILRRLIRRAVRAGQTIGFKDFGPLLSMMVEQFSCTRPSVKQHGQVAVEHFMLEHDKFLKTLEEGVRQLQKMTNANDSREITGEQAFKLFESYGFPVELTQEMAEEAGWAVDLTSFESQLEKHRQTSRAGLEKIFQGGLADHEPKTVAHHTAHHLLLAALRKVLGDHVVQRGSNVTSERLRIDVSHAEKITDDQLRMVEAMVNEKIAEDLPVVNETMQRDEALQKGALAEFGAKYPEHVSVYSIVDQDGEAFSRELCGGPHITNTGSLGKFEIMKEEGAGAGIRRIKARVV